MADPFAFPDYIVIIPFLLLCSFKVTHKPRERDRLSIDQDLSCFPIANYLCMNGFHGSEIIILNRNIIVTAFYEFAIIHCTMTEEEKAEVIAILAIDVQSCLQEYKETGQSGEAYKVLSQDRHHAVG